MFGSKRQSKAAGRVAQQSYRGWIRWANDAQQSWILGVERPAANGWEPIYAADVLRSLSNSLRAAHISTHTIRWPGNNVQIVFGRRTVNVDAEGTKLLVFTRQYYSTLQGVPIEWQVAR